MRLDTTRSVTWPLPAEAAPTTFPPHFFDQDAAMTRPYFLGLDFDGTLVDHRYPDIGAEAKDAFAWLKRWQTAGATLFLWTMRSDTGPDGPVLTDAVNFCAARGVRFAGVNENPSQKSWTSSPKLYANIIVDDNAFGCPLMPGPRIGSRPIVDWSVVGPAVLARVEAHFASQKPA